MPETSRKMSEAEIARLHRERIEVGAVGQNASVCLCGRIEHFPNIECDGLFIGNSIFHRESCDWCEHRDDIDRGD